MHLKNKIYIGIYSLNPPHDVILTAQYSCCNRIYSLCAFIDMNGEPESSDYRPISPRFLMITIHRSGRLHQSAPPGETAVAAFPIILQLVIFILFTFPKVLLLL